MTLHCSVTKQTVLVSRFGSTARVYAILTGQLVFTAGTIQAFHMNPGLRDWMFMHPAGRKGA